MDATVLNASTEFIKACAPFLGAVGGPVAFFAWWTSRRTQTHQNSKVVLDVLQATLTTAPDDPGYKKFLEDLRKEKLVKLAFGCSVRPEDFGRLMAYYDQGFATTGEICSAWSHRNPSGKPLSFHLSLFENIFLVFVVIYIAACALMSVLTTVVLFSLPVEAGRQVAPYALVYLGLAGFTFLIFRGHFIALMLRRREKRHAKVQPSAT